MIEVIASILLPLLPPCALASRFGLRPIPELLNAFLPHATRAA
jgi:hypothetical protein